MSTEPTDKLLATASEAAQMLGISRTTLYSLHSAGKIPMPLKLNRCTRWRIDELRAFVAAGMPSRQKWESIKDNHK
jgi:excisionase family DNA binding protein